MNADQRRRVEAAFRKYDGDACRPGLGIEAPELAAIILRQHWDLATCYCPVCVMARAVLNQETEAVVQLRAVRELLRRGWRHIAYNRVHMWLVRHDHQRRAT